MSSGVGTMSREFVMGSVHHFDWVQVGGAIKHPEQGKVVDMKQAVKDELGINGYLKIYPISGYGNEQILREIMKIEKPLNIPGRRKVLTKNLILKAQESTNSAAEASRWLSDSYNTIKANL